MQDKFEINWNYYPSEKSKLIYKENLVERKTLQHLKLCLQLNFITFFTTINNLFNYLKDIFGNSYQKKHAMKRI